MAGIFWTPHRRKTGIFVLATTTTILVILVLTINSLLAPIIARKIKNAVIKSSDSLYKVSFSGLDLNVFTGKAVLKNVRLVPDSTRPAAQLYTASAEQLMIIGARPLSYLFSKKLEIGQIALTDPVVSLKLLKPSPPEPKNSQTLYQKISKDIKLISVGSILLEHARLNFFDYSAAEPSVYHLKEWNLDATGLLIDSATQKDTTRTLYCHDITTGVRNFTMAAGDGIYNFELKSAQFSTYSQKLVARGIAIKPLPANTFFTRTKADRISFDLDSMVLNHFNYRSFMFDHYLEVKKLSAYKGDIGIFANPNHLLSKVDRVVTFPNYIIRSLKTHFAVDTLDISAFDVVYNEINPASAKTGTLLFKNTKVRFLNITNQQSKLNIRDNCSAQISSSFMGTGKLDVAFVFNLTDKVYGYSYHGHLDAMPLVAINPLVMPLALVKIKSGTLKSLDFSIEGNQRNSTGSLHLLYNALNVELLNKDYGNQGLKSFVVNNIIIKPDNPSLGTPDARFAKIVYIRPKNYAFFKTLWQTLFSGIKPCAGVGYAVKPDAAKPESKQEQEAEKKALKKTIKAKKDADKQYQEHLKAQSVGKKKT